MYVRVWLHPIVPVFLTVYVRLYFFCLCEQGCLHLNVYSLLLVWILFSNVHVHACICKHISHITLTTLVSNFLEDRYSHNLPMSSLPPTFLRFRSQLPSIGADNTRTWSTCVCVCMSVSTHAQKCSANIHTRFIKFQHSFLGERHANMVSRLHASVSQWLLDPHTWNAKERQMAAWRWRPCIRRVNARACRLRAKGIWTNMHTQKRRRGGRDRQKEKNPRRDECMHRHILKLCAGPVFVCTCVIHTHACTRIHEWHDIMRGVRTSSCISCSECGVRIMGRISWPGCCAKCRIADAMQRFASSSIALSLHPDAWVLPLAQILPAVQHGQCTIPHTSMCVCTCKFAVTCADETRNHFAAYLLLRSRMPRAYARAKPGAW